LKDRLLIWQALANIRCAPRRRRAPNLSRKLRKPPTNFGCFICPAALASHRQRLALRVSDPVGQRVWLAVNGRPDWRTTTTDWLRQRFGEYLISVVEHSDEEYPHLHFYLVPKLLPDLQLDLLRFHPGRGMKAAAAEAGASKKDQDA
jgi:hypothetical protein